VGVLWRDVFSTWGGGWGVSVRDGVRRCLRWLSCFVCGVGLFFGGVMGCGFGGVCVGGSCCVLGGGVARFFIGGWVVGTAPGLFVFFFLGGVLVVGWVGCGGGGGGGWLGSLKSMRKRKKNLKKTSYHASWDKRGSATGKGFKKKGAGKEGKEDNRVRNRRIGKGVKRRRRKRPRELSEG